MNTPLQTPPTTPKKMGAPKKTVRVIRFQTGVLIVVIAILVFVGQQLWVVNQYTLQDIKQEQPVPLQDVRPLQFDLLQQQSFMQMSQFRRERRQSQFAGVVWDTEHPPVVQNFVALNARVGGEVALFWTSPPTVDLVRIYRANTDTADDEPVVVAELTPDTETYIDTNLLETVQYNYTAVSVIVDEDGTEYESAFAVSPHSTVVPKDTLPPVVPENVSVTEHLTAGKPALLISWELVEPEDVSKVTMYRSTIYGDRGESIGVVNIGEQPDQVSFIDDSIQENIIYYYSAVAEDFAGNSTSTPFVAGAQQL